MQGSLTRIMVIVVFLSLATASGIAQQKPEFPKEHQAFIAELAVIMKKYPKAAEQFKLRDSSPVGGKPQSVARHCCDWDCEWSPPGSNPVGCVCKEQCLK